MTSRNIPNPASDHPDDQVREAFAALHSAQDKVRYFGDRWRMTSFVTQTGDPFLIIQFRDIDGRWQTVARLSPTGNLALKTGVSSPADFNSEGSNPADV